MPSTEELLDAMRKDAPSKALRCRYARWLDEQEGSLRDALILAATDPGITHIAISRFAARSGAPASDSVIRLHLKGNCCCYRNAAQ